MKIPISQNLTLSRKSDYLETVSEIDRNRNHLTWPEGTTVWIEFSDGTRWDAEVDESTGTAVFNVDKVSVDLVPNNSKYWLYISKPNQDHNVDMLLRYGAVIRRG